MAHLTFDLATQPLRELNQFLHTGPLDADLHLTDIDNRLRKMGLPSVLAAYCAGDVVALIKRDAENIRATQRELQRRAITDPPPGPGVGVTG